MKSKEPDSKSIASRSQSIDEFIARLSIHEDKSIMKPHNRTEPNDCDRIDSEESETSLNESANNSDTESIVLETDDSVKNWWKQSVTGYAFNLPTVRANLARLVGTDEGIIDDHQFMMNLRTSVWNEFDVKLRERVKQREAEEIERTKTLILKCKYNGNNCPKTLIPLHSEVLALDLPDVPIKLDKPLPPYNGPIFNINRKSNVSIRSRRSRIRTIRRRNYECLIRYVLKDLKISEQLKYDENRAVQGKIKTIHDSERKKKQSKHLAFITKVVKKVKSIFKREIHAAEGVRKYRYGTNV